MYSGVPCGLFRAGVPVLLVSPRLELGVASMQNRLLKAVAVVVFAVACGCGESSMLKKNRPLYEEAIHWLEAGAIKADSAGRVRLPMELQAASVDGEIYLFQPYTNQMVVVFKTWRGKGHNMEGFLYANPPLGESSTQTDYYGKQVISAGPIQLTLDKQIDAHWHKVSYKLD
jgi:hypothetical protein